MCSAQWVVTVTSKCPEVFCTYECRYVRAVIGVERCNVTGAASTVCDNQRYCDESLRADAHTAVCVRVGGLAQPVVLTIASAGRYVRNDRIGCLRRATDH
jgi:hypothetical protein